MLKKTPKLRRTQTSRRIALGHCDERAILRQTRGLVIFCQRLSMSPFRSCVCSGPKILPLASVPARMFMTYTTRTCVLCYPFSLIRVGSYASNNSCSGLLCASVKSLLMVDATLPSFFGASLRCPSLLLCLPFHPYHCIVKLS